MYPSGVPTSGNVHPDDAVRFLPAGARIHGEWTVTVYWVTTPDGRAVPARLIVEASELAGIELGDRLPVVDLPSLSGGVLRSLPLGTYIAESRDEVLSGLAAGDPDRAAMSAPALSSYDDRRRRAVEVVHRVVRQGNRRSPYAEASLVLHREGISGPDGEPVKPRRLAKWIKDAERRGEYPPPNQQEETE